MGISSTLIVISIGLAWSLYRKYSVPPANTGFGKILENKWYVDELYQMIILNPLKWLAAFFNNILEIKLIDGTVNGVGKFVNYSSRQLRWLQSGQVGAYILLMVIGMLLLFFIQLFL
jgi:NADH-quinone oxidoreductase subunit L